MLSPALRSGTELDSDDGSAGGAVLCLKPECEARRERSCSAVPRPNRIVASERFAATREAILSLRNTLVSAAQLAVRCDRCSVARQEARTRTSILDAPQAVPRSDPPSREQALGK